MLWKNILLLVVCLIHISHWLEIMINSKYINTIMFYMSSVTLFCSFVPCASIYYTYIYIKTDKNRTENFHFCKNPFKHNILFVS